MNLFLRNLCQRLTGRAAARPAARRARTARPQLEALEDRAVPTVSILNQYFSLPTGTLYITSENYQTGHFSGYFNEFSGSARTTVLISGVITPQTGGGWDPMTFSGTTGGRHGLNVAFQGEAMQGGPYGGLSELQGFLTESITGVRGYIYHGETGLGIGYPSP